MIELWYAPTPNGWKISILLEETGLPYRLRLMNLGAGDQFDPDFLAISPNNRMPAIVDDEGPDGHTVRLFESGAILVYLAEKTGRFLPPDPLARLDVLQWTFWQVGGLGPMAGQLSHFVNYAPGGPEAHPYSHKRYFDEYDRLLGVMERSLSQREFLAGDAYSIADMAAWPWIVPYKRFEADLDAYPGVRRWFDAIKARPAVRAGMDLGKDARRVGGELTDEQRRIMFGQTGRNSDELRKQD